eukprot:scaffold4501_cov108-Isochrysis_galbana.AAC.2
MPAERRTAWPFGTSCKCGSMPPYSFLSEGRLKGPGAARDEEPGTIRLGGCACGDVGGVSVWHQERGVRAEGRPHHSGTSHAASRIAPSGMFWCERFTVHTKSRGAAKCSGDRFQRF